MPIRLLVSFDQSTMLDDFGPSADGVCYYLRNYVEEHVWCCRKNYDAAHAAAIDMIRHRNSLINYARVQNIQHYKQQDYSIMPQFFEYNRIYRVALWTGRIAVRPQPFAQNHEMIICTGTFESRNWRCFLLFFEPNFGLYEIITNDKKIGRDILEKQVDTLYQQKAHCSAVNFTYRNVRSISAKGPLSFK